MKRSKYRLICLFAILLLAAFFRFYQLGYLPQAFGRDEAALGYNAYSLIITGRDEWGNFLPLTLRSFEDNKPAVYSYFSAPLIGLFGLSEITTRLVSALSGLFACVLLYLLISHRFRRPQTALLATIVLTLSPWHWELSRTATEANLALTLGLLAVYWFLSPRRVFQWLGLVAMITSLYTYHTPRLIMPELFILALLILKPKRSPFQWGVIVVGVILGGWLSLTQTMNRLEQVSLFTDLGGQLIRAESIREDGTAPHLKLLATRIFHNKIETWTRIFLSNFTTNTSIQYLFFGPSQPLRTAIPETGQFLLVFAPAYFFGLVASIKRFQSHHLFMFGWFLLSVIPASLTVADTPSSYRTLFLIVPISYFIGEGLHWLIIYLKSLPYRWLLTSLGLLILTFTCFNTARAWHQYAIHQQVHEPWYRQYGYRDLFHRLATFPQDMPITITNRPLGEPYIYTLFYGKVDPRLYQQSPEKRLSPAEMSQGKMSFHFGRYVYSELICPYPDELPTSQSLYVVAAECPLREGYKRLDTIKFMDGQPIFHLDLYEVF